MFVFAGRRPNMELQLPCVRRILENNPSVEYHVWNLTYNKTDTEYVRSIKGERITVIEDLYGKRGGRDAWNKVFKHYADRRYQDHLFVKTDDDIVFIETQRFAAFINAIDKHRDAVLSANTINNGACTPMEPGLWEEFTQLGIPLLDIHKHNTFADMAHNYFFQHAATMLDQPIQLVPTEDWISINMIGYDWPMARHLAAEVGKVPHPPYIAGRRFPLPWGMGDEGAVNMLPRIVMRGFTAGHLGFGKQGVTDDQAALWRRRYKEIGKRYLTDHLHTGPVEPLPDLSPISCANHDIAEPDPSLADWAIRSGWDGENNPTAGRFTP